MNLIIRYLEEEPKIDKRKQILYNFTRPIAKLRWIFKPLQFLHLLLRRKLLADLNKMCIIEDISKQLFINSIDIKLGMTLEEFEKHRVMCMLEATSIFKERKRRGLIDELNTPQ